MKELAGGDHSLQQAGDPPRRLTWEEARSHSLGFASLSSLADESGAECVCCWLQVRQYEPEVLVLSPCSCNPSRTLTEVSSLAGLPGWWSLPAVKSGHVYIVDHSYFARPGPRSEPAFPRTFQNLPFQTGRQLHGAAEIRISGSVSATAGTSRFVSRCRGALLCEAKL